MLQFMREGGYAMWFILVLGGVTLGIAVSFAVRPTERKLAVIRPLSVSTVFLILSGIFAGLSTSLHTVSTHPKLADSPDQHNYLMIGLGESMCPAILGFSILALVWLIAAVGLRRHS